MANKPHLYNKTFCVAGRRSLCAPWSCWTSGAASRQGGMPLKVCASPSIVLSDGLVKVGSGYLSYYGSELVNGDHPIMSFTDNLERNSTLKSSSSELTNHSLAISLSEVKESQEEEKGSKRTTAQDAVPEARHTVDGSNTESYFSSPLCHAQSLSSAPGAMFTYPGQHGPAHPTFSITSPNPYMAHHPVITSGHYNGLLTSSSRQGYPAAGYPYAQQYGHGYQDGPLYQFSAGPASLLSGKAQVYLCNRALWLKFHRHQTEMIITRQGRYVSWVYIFKSH